MQIIHSTLRAMLAEAMRDELVKRNVVGQQPAGHRGQLACGLAARR